jgi:hypothetical protein
VYSTSKPTTPPVVTQRFAFLKSGEVDAALKASDHQSASPTVYMLLMLLPSTDFESVIVNRLPANRSPVL